MSITPEQIQIVKSTWSLLRQVQPHVFGDVFYHKLFLDYPTLRSRYPEDMTTQYPELMAFLSTIVSRLDRPQELKLALTTMNHQSVWTNPEHLHKLGQALRWTLQKGLGTDWNKQVDAAWQKCINQVIDQLKTA